jgi:hypothetical protein
MSIFINIAEANPDGCLILLQRYGYINQNITSIQDIASSLEIMVTSEDDKCFREMLKMHPDREVIIADYIESVKNDENSKKNKLVIHPSYDCSCKSTNEMEKNEMSKNANGNNVQLGSISMQTNTLVIVGAIIIGAVIVASSR